MEDSFTNFYSILEEQKGIITFIKNIEKEWDMDITDNKEYRFKENEALYNLFIEDESDDKSDFNNAINSEIKLGFDFIETLNKELATNIEIEKGKLREINNELTVKSSNWQLIISEQSKLELESLQISEKLDELLHKKRRYVDNAEFIKRKYSEYGDDATIYNLYETWLKEYKTLKSDYIVLDKEYIETLEETESIPKSNKDLKVYIKDKNNEIVFAVYEINELFNIMPDLEARAVESEEIHGKYNKVHKDFLEKKSEYEKISSKFDTVSKDNVSLKEEHDIVNKELIPLKENDNTLKVKLAELTETFNKFNELNEESVNLKKILDHLEKTILEWTGKIEAHAKKQKDMEDEVESLKTESQKYSKDIKEYEELIGPVKTLNESLKSAQSEISEISVAEKSLTEEIHKLRKENETLSIKAKQFEMIKKKLGK